MSTVSVSIPVPISGFGPAVDVSALVGEKTVLLSGRYSGAYVLYGSHDGSNFAPLLIFNAGGIEGIRQTISGAFSQMRLKSLTSRASGVSLSVSGAFSPGDNSFVELSGGVLDLGNDAFQTDLNFMGFGQVNGMVVVEGSLDGAGWNPIGEFAASVSGTSLLGGGSGIEFSPLSCPDRVRYVRLNLQGAMSGFVVTVGGAKSSVIGGVETLAAAYMAGVTSVDQILVLDDAKGGKVVFDASDVGFTDPIAMEVLVPGGVGMEALSHGGLNLGPNNIVIGIVGSSVSVVGESAVGIGRGLTVSGDYSIGIANQGAVSPVALVGISSVLIGAGSNLAGNCAVLIGPDSYCEGECEVFMGFGNIGGAGAVNGVVIGRENRSGDGTDGCFMIGRGNMTGTGASYNALFGETNHGYSQFGLIEGFDNESVDMYQIVLGNGSKGELQASGAVVIGHGARAGNSVTLPSSMNAIATGTGAVVEGDEGMAFGTGAFAGAGEIVFSSGSVGGANRFEVVASTTGNPDLFSFDVSLVGSANTTALTLLVTKDDGLTTASLPVTLSTSDPITHMSNLQVLNN